MGVDRAEKVHPRGQIEKHVEKMELMDHENGRHASSVLKVFELAIN